MSPEATLASMKMAPRTGYAVLCRAAAQAGAVCEAVQARGTVWPERRLHPRVSRRKAARKRD
jgi:hypothetical protein